MQLNRLALEVQKCFFVCGGDNQYAFFISILPERDVFAADAGAIVESPNLIISFVRNNFTSRRIKSLVADDITNVNSVRAAKFNECVAVFANGAEKDDWFLSYELKVI